MSEQLRQFVHAEIELRLGAPVDDVVIIVRSVEERTEGAAIRLAAEPLGTAVGTHVIRHRPFAEAHDLSIRFALESGARWALFLDADVLLKSGAVREMAAAAAAVSSPFFMLNFRLLDRGFGGPAYGTHLYSVDQLEPALDLVDRVYKSQRPETGLYFLVAETGVPTLNSPAVMGIHGYEQYYRDLYRTAFVRAVKFGERLGYFLKRYRFAFERSGENGDRDDAVLLAGLLDGLVYRYEHDSAPLEAEFYFEQARIALAGLQLDEKGPLRIDQDTIDRILHDHVPDDLYLDNAGLDLCSAGSGDASA